MDPSLETNQEDLETLCEKIHSAFHHKLLAESTLYALDVPHSILEKSPNKRNIAEVEQPEQADQKRQHLLNETDGANEEETTEEKHILIHAPSSSDSDSDEAEYEPLPLTEDGSTIAQYSSITSPFWRARSASHKPNMENDTEDRPTKKPRI